MQMFFVIAFLSATVAFLVLSPKRKEIDDDEEDPLFQRF